MALPIQLCKINVLPYRIWDEARLATNAYEMTKAGSPLITTMDGAPDMWNTKPPLMVWAQAICIRVHGLSEFSVRFPAAFSGVLTILLLSLFVYYITKSVWVGVLSAVILSTSTGYIGYHGTRYGEYDGMLTLFTTAYLISFFMYTEAQGPSRNRYLMLFFLLITAAVFTKSIAGLFFTPALFFYLIIRKQFISTVTNKWFYLGCVGLVIFVGGYYVLRNYYNPGYLQAVYNNELGGRFAQTNENHVYPWYYYLKEAKESGFTNWFWLLPLSIVICFTLKTKSRIKVYGFLMLCAIVYLSVISISKTKLPWYSLPVYPLFAAIGALTVFHIINIIYKYAPVSKYLITSIVVILISIKPTYDIYNFIKYQYDDLSANNFYAPSYFLRDAINGSRNLSNSVYLYAEYCPQYRLYIKRLNIDGNNIHEECCTGNNIFKQDDRVIANDEVSKNYITNNYNYQILENFYSVNLFLIKSHK